MLFRSVVFACLLPLASFGQFRSTQWTADSGLPQNSVRGIVQTPDGYIWVATLNGVARFDGVRFTVFDKSDTAGMSSNRFGAMVAGAPGDLWLAGEDGNVVRFHHGVFRTLGQEVGIRPNSVTGVTGDGHGGIWICSDEVVYRWNESANRFERQQLGSAENRFKSLWWVGTGFWAIEKDQLVYLVRGNSKSHRLPEWIAKAGVRGVAVGVDEAVWIATLDGRFVRMLNDEYAIVNDTIDTPMKGRGMESWKARIERNFDRIVTFPSGGTEKGIHYNFITTDTEGNIWIGSEAQGLFRIQKQFISVYSTAQGLAGPNIYPILKSKNGDMWVGSWPAGLSRIHNGEVSTFTLKDGLPGLPTSLAEDRGGNLWVGTHGGLRMFSHGRFTTPPNFPKDETPPVQVIYEATDGSMLLGTSRGIYLLNGAGYRLLTTKDGLASDDARVIISRRNGEVWIGGYGGLTQMSGGVLKRWTEKDGLPSNNVRSIYEDAAGDLWVGTYDGGLGLFHDGKWTAFNKKSGLFDNGAFQVLEDARQNLWISSNRGIYRVSKAQLYAVAEGREKRVESIGYGKSDGMLSVECNGGLWPGGAKDDRGFLWFPTQDGVAVVNPEALTRSERGPAVVIESVALDHVDTGRVDAVKIVPGQSSLEIQYTALSFSKPEQTYFRYKLEGIDEDWEYGGQGRVAYYKHLPPGDYVFRLVAVNSDGVSSMEKTLPVEVVPPFYRRLWFLALVCVAVLVIAWILWTYRIRQLKRMQSAQKAFSQQLIASQENERRRIAAELHDSLGQRLIVINNLALFLLRPKGKPTSEEDKRQTLQEITSEATSAMEETRAISYDLRPFQLDRLGLSKAIVGLARTASRASGIQFVTELGEIDHAFPEELRINFFRIVQEAVNNIIKHSGGDQAEIKTTTTASILVLSIKDNGKGLPTEPHAVHAGPGGFGLTGIQERANLLHGKMKIRGHAGEGTMLTITFLLERNQENV